MTINKAYNILLAVLLATYVVGVAIGLWLSTNPAHYSNYDKAISAFFAGHGEAYTAAADDTTASFVMVLIAVATELAALIGLFLRRKWGFALFLLVEMMAFASYALGDTIIVLGNVESALGDLISLIAGSVVAFTIVAADQLGFLPTPVSDEAPPPAGDTAA